MNNWQPEHIKDVVLENGTKLTIGFDCYRFYILMGNNWESCMEYKYCTNPLVDVLAKHLWDKA